MAYKTIRLHFLKLGLLAATLWILIYLHTVRYTIYNYIQTDSHAGVAYVMDFDLADSSKGKLLAYNGFTITELKQSTFVFSPWL